jgi:hypothetical protein
MVRVLMVIKTASLRPERLGKKNGEMNHSHSTMTAKKILRFDENTYLRLTVARAVPILLRPAFDVGACWSVIRRELHVEDSFLEGLIAPCPDRMKSLEFEWKRMTTRFWIRVPWRS